MKINMGGTDRLIRIVLAIAALMLYFSNLLPEAWNIVMLVVAGIFLLTSFVSFCPLYRLLGISTLRAKN